MSERLCEVCGKPTAGNGVFMHSADGKKSWHGDCFHPTDEQKELAALRERCERLEKALAVAAITLATVFKKDFEPYMGRMKPLLDKTKDLKIERVEDYVTSALSHPDVSQEKGKETR